MTLAQSEAATRRRRKPRNPKVAVRDLSYYADVQRKSDHTSLRMDDQTRAKLRELSARTYGGTSQSTVIRLLIQAAWAELKRKEVDLDPRTRSQVSKPADEPAYSDPTPESLAQDSGMTPEQIRGLLRLGAKMADDGSELPAAMVAAWEPFDHRPWIPGLRRIWAWVQGRETRLRRLLTGTRRQIADEEI